MTKHSYDEVSEKKSEETIISFSPDNWYPYKSGESFVLPLSIGSAVYRKDGKWTVCGYDCNRFGEWRIKLKRQKSNNINETEHAKPLVRMYGKSFWSSEEEMTQHYGNEIMSDQE